MALLEPDSFLASGFFLEILQRAEYIEPYFLAPLAEQMLANDPVLKTAFAAQLAADPKIRRQSHRPPPLVLRTPYYDASRGLYPHRHRAAICKKPFRTTISPDFSLINKLQSTILN